MTVYEINKTLKIFHRSKNTKKKELNDESTLMLELKYCLFTGIKKINWY